LLLLGSTLWQTTASQKALGDLRQQGERLEHLDGMLIQLMDIENVARSYLLDGNRQADSIHGQLSGLRASVMAEGQTSFERSTYHLERTRRVVVGLAAGALTLMIILFVVLERQLRLRAQLAEMLHDENQRLDSLVHERTAELSDLASYLTNVREAEKARLARELHDELGALLTVAKMESNWIAGRLDEATRTSCGERLARLDEQLDRGIALKRRIIDGLRPPFLEELGLVSTLRTLGEEFERDGEETLNLRLPNADIELEPAAALALFRIAQEALTNIRKHARADSVTLALRVTNTRLELEITDDGVGFRTGRARGRQHGLDGMKHRVQMCAGDFHFVSRPGAGTRIVVGIPGPIQLSVNPLRTA
jgi:signal transduction histidine kinase